LKPLWFGPEDRPLFGWLHLPESGEARGAVLLCPTIGIEAVNARYAYMYLADRLAEAGLACFRFDYDGTGDSAGQQNDPDRVQAWLHSIQLAMELVRGLRTDRIGVVGLRMGATLLAESFGSGPAVVDDLVLWDPCASGRSFLREQSALWAFALGKEAAGDGSVETPGLVYDKDTVAAMSPLAIANGDGPLAGRVLVLTRAGRNGDRRANERLALPHTERLSIAGQEELVDVLPDAAKIPEATISSIVEWLVSGADAGKAVAIDADTVGRPVAVVGTAPDGTPIEERAAWLGPLGLFAMVTSRVGPEATVGESGGADELPTIFFLNAGVIDHVGPAGLWVRLGRRWAEAGFRAIRFDLSGNGDSPVHPGQRSRAIFSSHHEQDVVDVLRAVSPRDPANAVLVGLCSGGFNSIEPAIEVKVRGLCALNPILTFKDVNAQDAGTPGQGQAQTKGGMKGWVGKVPGYTLINRISKRLPSSAWWVINRIAVDITPARRLAKVVDAGVDVLVIAGTDEGRWLSGGETRTLHRLAQTGRFRMEVIPGLEHTLFEHRTREIAVEILSDHVQGRFGAPTTAR
jgi:alpha-beta hydrolase superfamily lysophospholipase